MVPPIRHSQPEARRQGAVLMLSIEIRTSGVTELSGEGWKDGYGGADGKYLTWQERLIAWIIL